MKLINWPDPNNAVFLLIDDVPPECQSTISIVATEAGSPIHFLKGRDFPWNTKPLATEDVLNGKQQVFCFVKELSAAALAIVTYAIESGFDTYIVLTNGADLSLFDLVRIEVTAAKMLTLERFLEETHLLKRSA